MSEQDPVTGLIEKVTDAEARAFLDEFLVDRRINTEYYKRVPEHKLDFKMVDTPQIQSDSPRKSLDHHIYVTRKYIYGIRTGELKFDGITDKPLENPENMSKEELLKEFNDSTRELIELLALADIADKLVKVPWDNKPVRAVTVLDGLDKHEIFHQGWNLALMDHLGVERFPELRQMWG